ncbi:UNVERIFIED_CONTAM: hypothetical protein GTU68_018160 [Idotea baltica]|nr:hypothetical protein [Idotea baltica]
MCLHTLKMMERGGIHDHIAQGFARYSTDKKWHVPHFEKMLYDQAQLVMSYLDAFLLTKEPLYAEVVRDIITYVTRDLSHPLGGFYSAEDADSFPSSSSSEKREGAFCVWSYEEICELLSAPVEEGKETKLFQVFNFHFSVAEGGNLHPYQDPHDEMKNQNVLIAHDDLALTASEFDMDEGECKQCLERCRLILYEARSLRPKPHLDDKMLTAWNGMMLAASARAGAVLNDKSYIERAIQAAEFVKKHLFRNGLLFRAAYKGEGEEVSLGSEIEGFADDYAWMVRGLFHLYDATLNEEWLRWAEELQDKQNELFWDETSGGYFMTKKDDDTILLRLKNDHDGAEPSVNSVSAGNLIYLFRLLNRPDYEEKASAIFKVFSDRLLKVPISLPEMVTAYMLFTYPDEQIILSGQRTTASLSAMLEVVHASRLNPNRTILLADADQDSFLYSRHNHLKKFVPKGAEATAYVCKDFACSLPFKCSSLLREKMVNG